MQRCLTVVEHPFAFVVYVVMPFPVEYSQSSSLKFTERQAVRTPLVSFVIVRRRDDIVVELIALYLKRGL